MPRASTPPQLINHGLNISTGIEDIAKNAPAIRTFLPLPSAFLEWICQRLPPIFSVFESEAKLYGLNQEFDHDGSPHLCFVSDILFRPCSFYFKWPSEKEKNWVRMENFKSYHLKVCSGNLYGGKKNLMLWKRGYSERKNLIESKRSRPMRYFLAANEIIYLIQWYLLFEWPRSLWNLVTLNQLKFNLNQVNVFAWWNLWTAQVKITQ